MKKKNKTLRGCHTDSNALNKSIYLRSVNLRSL